MWQINIKETFTELGHWPWPKKDFSKPPEKPIKPVSPDDLKRQANKVLQNRIDNIVLEINGILSNGGRKYKLAVIDVDNKIIERLNAKFREVGWKVCIIRHGNDVTFEFLAE